MKLAVLLTCLAVALTGCATSGSSGGDASTPAASSITTTDDLASAAPSQSSSSAPSKDASYSSVVRLRDAAIAAGYACSNWVEDDAVANASESGTCSDDDVFCVYASTTGRDAQIAQTRANNGLLKDAGIATAVVLFGPNWSINLPKSAADQVSLVLGGTEAK